MRPLDEFLPEYEFAERHSIRAHAPAAALDDAVRGIHADDIPVLKALMRLRALGRRRPSRPFVDVGLLLESVSGEGLVLGLTGRFWELRGSSVAQPTTPEEFLADRRPDVCKAVIDFRFADGEVTTETRVHVADPRARRTFARYWRVIRPFSGLTRIVFLREARRRAEAVS